MMENKTVVQVSKVEKAGFVFVRGSLLFFENF